MSERSPFDAFDGDTLDVVVPGALDGVRIDRALALLTGLSRTETHALVAGGGVRVDDHSVTKSSLALVAGQHLIAVLAPRDDGFVAPNSDVALSVVLDDEDFVVVNKSPGVVVHPGAGQRTGTLVAGILARYPEVERLSRSGLCDPSRPGIVHRLDKGTSGLLVVAKTPEGFASLSAQLAQRTMQRTYVGLVEGHVIEDRGIIDAPIGRSTRQPTMMVVRSDGRAARTAYRVLGRLEVPHATTLLELKLETGRTHQIRVHLATISHPIVNDTRYGHRRDRRLDDERVFLHASDLSFIHPRFGDRVQAHAPLPADLHALVAELDD